MQMKRCAGSGLFIVLGCLGSTVFAAQDDLAFRDCAAIDDDAERLACFDRAAVELSPPASEGEPDTADHQGDTTALSHEPVDHEPTDAPAPKVPAAAPSTAISQPDEVAATRRSDSRDMRQFAAEPPADPPDEFTAVVTAVSKRPLGHHVVELENGQIWAEEFASSYFPVEVGDTVTIKKRFFTGYRLVAPSGKGYSVEKVN